MYVNSANSQSQMRLWNAIVKLQEKNKRILEEDYDEDKGELKPAPVLRPTGLIKTVSKGVSWTPASATNKVSL